MMPVIASMAALPWRRIGIAVAAATLLAIGWAVNGWRLGRELERLHRQIADERRAAAWEQSKAVDSARLKYQREVEAQTRIANEATRQRDVALADARAARGAEQRVRDQVAALVRQYTSPGDSTFAGGGAPAGDAVRVLADVLERADRRAGVLAEALDASFIAGLACERAYDALVDNAAMTNGTR